MTAIQKYIVWAVGILVWIFVLSILLSYITFGYLDLPTIRYMALVLSPILFLAAVLLFRFRKGEEKNEKIPIRILAPSDRSSLSLQAARRF